MENRPKHRVDNVDRINGDVIVTFDDGKTAIFPASVLYELLPQVRERLVNDTAEPD